MVKYIRENNIGIKSIPLKCIRDAYIPSKRDIKCLPQYMCGCECSAKLGRDDLIGYWLMNEGRYGGSCIIRKDGTIDENCPPTNSHVGVRPVLVFDWDNAELDIDDKFEFNGETYTVYDYNLYGKAICDVMVAQCVFNDSFNGQYQKSKLNEFIELWFQDAMDNSIGIKSDRQIADEQDLGF